MRLFSGVSAPGLSAAHCLSRLDLSLLSLRGRCPSDEPPPARTVRVCGHCKDGIFSWLPNRLCPALCCDTYKVVTAEEPSVRPHWGPREPGAELTGFGDMESEAPEALAGSQNSLRISRGDRQPRSAFAGRDPSPRRRPARPAPRRSERRASEFPRARGSGPATLPASSVTRSWPVAFSESLLPRRPSGDKTKNNDAGL